MKTHTINEVAGNLELNSQTLRKWEKDFKLKIPRNDKGHRYYTDKEVELLENIKNWKDKGANIKVINNYLGRTEEFKDQKEQALELITLDKLTGKEIKELMAKQMTELVIEREQALKEAFKKELKEELEKQQQKITEQVFQQVKEENQKLRDYIASTREDDYKKSFWSKIFGK